MLLKYGLDRWISVDQIGALINDHHGRAFIAHRRGQQSESAIPITRSYPVEHFTIGEIRLSRFDEEQFWFSLALFRCCKEDEWDIRLGAELFDKP